MLLGSHESALSWIGSLTDNYVIVFDNADVLAPEELECYFPPGLGGNILITSRNSTMQRLTSPENSLKVPEMEKNDAILLLLKASCLCTSQTNLQAEACEIVKKLFCVPLVIDQAGALISAGAFTIKDYPLIYSQHRKALLSHLEFKGASSYNRTVYGTWELVYKEIQHRAESNNPDRSRAAKSAMLILGIFSFLHYENIPEEIFAPCVLEQSQRIIGERHIFPFGTLPLVSSKLHPMFPPLSGEDTYDHFVFKGGLQLLLCLCFIKKGASDGLYDIHPLIHAWVRDRMTVHESKKHCSMAYILLACSIRLNQSYEVRRVLIAHVRFIARHHFATNSERADRHLDDACQRFASILLEQGHPDEAEKLAAQLVDSRSEILGKQHPDTLTAMSILATAYTNGGKYEEAEKMGIQVFDERKKMLGEEHPNTITALANLAGIYRYLGKYTEAETLEIQVLNARTKLLGKNHPTTVIRVARG